MEAMQGGNLDKKDVGNLRIEDPFVKEIAIIKKKI